MRQAMDADTRHLRRPVRRLHLSADHARPVLPVTCVTCRYRTSTVANQNLTPASLTPSHPRIQRLAMFLSTGWAMRALNSLINSGRAGERRAARSGDAGGGRGADCRGRPVTPVRVNRSARPGRPARYFASGPSPVSCCIITPVSVTPQCSTAFPFSKPTMSTVLTRNARPCDGTPRNSAAWVPDIVR